MSLWAVVVMIVLVLLAVGIVLVARHRGAGVHETGAGPAAPGRTVRDLVRDRSGAEPDEAPAAEPEPESVAAPDAAAEPVPEAAPVVEPPATEYPRPGLEDVDAGPVGPPWTRGFVDGRPIEGPPRVRPRRRSTVDPVLVARVTSVEPPAPGSDEPVERGIVSPAVADAVARVEAARAQAALAPVEPAQPESGRDGGRVDSSRDGGRVDGARVDVGAPRPAPAVPQEVPGPREGAEAARPMLAVVRGSADAERAEPRRGLRVVSAGLLRVSTADRAVKSDPEPSSTEDSSDVAASVGPRSTVESPRPRPAPRPTPTARHRAPEAAAPATALEPTAPGAAAGGPAREIPTPPTSADPLIDTPPVTLPAGPVTLSGVRPPSSTPATSSEDAPAPVVDEARAAEHAAVDLALLRTLGFADPNPRRGAAPVVDMSLPHAADEPEVPGASVPVGFRILRRGQEPVADAAVTLLDPRGRETASAIAHADGTGEILAPRAGGYVLVASAAGHQPGVVAVVAGEPGQVEVQLVRSSAIAGTVRDAAGAPLAEAALSLLQDGELVSDATTTADGGYRFGELAAGEYTIAVLAGEREPKVVAVRLAEEADQRQDVVVPGVPTQIG